MKPIDLTLFLGEWCISVAFVYIVVTTSEQLNKVKSSREKYKSLIMFSISMPLATILTGVTMYFFYSLSTLYSNKHAHNKEIISEQKENVSQHKENVSQHKGFSNNSAFKQLEKYLDGEN